MEIETIVVVLLGILLLIAAAIAAARGARLRRLRALLGIDPEADLDLAVRALLDARSDAQFALDRDHRRQAQLVDFLTIGVIRTDAALVVQSANRAAHTILQRPSGALIGRGVIEAFPDHRVEEVIAEAARLGSAYGEAQVGGVSGTAVLVRARRAAANGVWVMLEDVTELRRLQRIRAEFIDNLSHELRTPLSTVRLLIETLAREVERDDLPPRVRDGISKIDIETGHLVQMVNELLDLARIEGGPTAPLYFDDLEVGRVVVASVERLQLFAERQGITLRVDLSENPAAQWIEGDEGRIGQLLLNLLHNAVKFSPSGSAVTVATRAVDDEVIISVRDQGVGIPQADLTRIFERFYKVDKARVRRAGGTGLGLAIARHIAESHRGRIWAESTEGAGSTFHVALPRPSRTPERADLA